MLNTRTSCMQTRRHCNGGILAKFANVTVALSIAELCAPSTAGATERNGTERKGTERNGTERNGPERNGTERKGTERNGTERHGTARNGTARDRTARDRTRPSRDAGARLSHQKLAPVAVLEAESESRSESQQALTVNVPRLGARTRQTTKHPQLTR